MGFQLPNLNWFSRQARFLKHQQYSHPSPNQPLATRFKTCIGSEAFRKGLSLASRRSRLSDAAEKKGVFVKRGRRCVETFAGKVVIFVGGGGNWEG